MALYEATLDLTAIDQRVERLADVVEDVDRASSFHWPLKPSTSTSLTAAP